MGYCIVTRYHGPTNYRGSRIIATGPSLTYGGRPVRATAPFSYEGPGTDGNPRAAAELVAAKLRAAGWSVTLAGESYRLPDDSGESWPLRYGDGPDATAILADILTGPTSASNAARLAPSAADHLAAAGYRIVRA